MECKVKKLTWKYWWQGTVSHQDDHVHPRLLHLEPVQKLWSQHPICVSAQPNSGVPRCPPITVVSVLKNYNPPLNSTTHALHLVARFSCTSVDSSTVYDEMSQVTKQLVTETNSSHLKMFFSDRPFLLDFAGVSTRCEKTSGVLETSPLRKWWKNIWRPFSWWS